MESQPLSNPDAERFVAQWLANGEPGILDRLDEITLDLFTDQAAVAVVRESLAMIEEGIEPIGKEVMQRIITGGKVEKAILPLVLTATLSPDIPANDATVTRQLDILRDYHRRRLMVGLCSRLLAGGMTTPQMIEEARKVMEGIDSAGTAPDSPRAILDAWVEHFEGLATGTIKAGIPTGIDCIDRETGGTRPGELWLPGGPTSSGKTALAVQIAGKMLDDGRAVMIASAEMSVGDVLDRLICNRSSVPLPILRDPARHLPVKRDLDAIKRAVERAKDYRLTITEDTGLDAIMAKARTIRRRGGLDLLVVDYAQLLDAGDGPETREQAVASISRRLKQFAKAEEIVVMLLTQLNDDGKPRNSRQLAFDADTVLLIEDEGIRLAKQRNGPAGHLLPLTLNGETQTFVEQTRMENAA